VAQPGEEHPAFRLPSRPEPGRQLARTRLPKQVAVTVANDVSMDLRLKHEGLLSPSTGR
jgi:hypothetical protein